VTIVKNFLQTYTPSPTRQMKSRSIWSGFHWWLSGVQTLLENTIVLALRSPKVRSGLQKIPPSLVAKPDNKAGG
jgi:hypothetical protein